MEETGKPLIKCLFSWNHIVAAEGNHVILRKDIDVLKSCFQVYTLKSSFDVVWAV